LPSDQNNPHYGADHQQAKKEKVSCKAPDPEVEENIVDEDGGKLKDGRRGQET